MHYYYSEPAWMAFGGDAPNDFDWQQQRRVLLLLPQAGS